MEATNDDDLGAAIMEGNNRENHDKHPLEESTSWELHLNRTQRGGALTNHQVHELNQRQLKKHHHHHHEKKKKKKKIPEPDKNTFHAMMIDAGSQGTRIHIYEFKERILYNKKEIQSALNGLKISTPTTNSRWTNRLKPGLDSCAYATNSTGLLKTLEVYLEPLLDFAKEILEHKSDEWENFPIYLKATGGLRTLPTVDRVRLMKHVRILFQQSKFNPFAFQEEYARVISGEEEAIYGWTAVNYIKGTLVKESEGIGTVLNPNLTYGMIEMGGASTQIGFFENNGDVMANLFKLQIGGARHWNVYVHSFLYFGVNGAWSRLNADLYDRGNGSGSITNSSSAVVKNPCLPVSSQLTFTSWIHINNESQLLPRSSPLSTPYSATIYNDRSDFESCSLITRKLLRIEANAEWVTFSHDGDASFAGIYQPPLPISSNPIAGSSIGGFIATSNFADIWAFLNLEETSTVGDVGKRAEIVCNYNRRQLTEYNSKLDRPIDDDVLDQFCFRSVFVYEMLHSGYGFPLEYEITAVDTLNHQKLGWALGSILYEINTLPWEFSDRVNIKGGREEEETLGLQNQFQHSPSSHIGSHVVLAVCAVLVGLAVHIRYRVRNSRSDYQSIPNSN